MNSWNKLLLLLDDVLGFKNKVKSNFKKIGQSFDEKTNEHIIHIEYRVSVGGGNVVRRKKVNKGNENLLRDLIKLGQKKR